MPPKDGDWVQVVPKAGDLLRVVKADKDYPKITYIFGIDHYTQLEKGKDEFSKNIMSYYDYGTYLDFFKAKLIEIFKRRFEGDSIGFSYMTVYPTHEKDTLNLHMVALAEELSKSVGLPYKQILRRNSTIKPNHELKYEGRKENVKGSVDVLEDVTGKKIIILDNVATTGASLRDITNELYKNGAEAVVCLCLGLCITGKDNDYQDVNKTMKISKIMEKIKIPKIPDDIYEGFKRGKEWKKV